MTNSVTGPTGFDEPVRIEQDPTERGIWPGDTLAPLEKDAKPRRPSELMPMEDYFESDGTVRSRRMVDPSIARRIEQLRGWDSSSWLDWGEELGWPLLDRLRQIHHGALRAIGETRQRRSDLERRFAAEDAAVATAAGDDEAKIEAALRAGEQPPAETEKPEVTSAAQRRVELRLADERIATAREAVEPVAVEVIRALAGSWHELDVAERATRDRLSSEGDAAADRAEREENRRWDAFYAGREDAEERGAREAAILAARSAVIKTSEVNSVSTSAGYLRNGFVGPEEEPVFAAVFRELGLPAPPLVEQRLPRSPKFDDTASRVAAAEAALVEGQS